MTANGNGTTHDARGMTVELLSEKFRPAGWPCEVRINELTAGEIFGMYEEGVGNKKGVEIQMDLLARCVFDASTGERLFTSADQIKQLPARMMPGLMEMLQRCVKLNIAVMPTDAKGHPTLPLNA